MSEAVGELRVYTGYRFLKDHHRHLNKQLALKLMEKLCLHVLKQLIVKTKTSYNHRHLRISLNFDYDIEQQLIF